MFALARTWPDKPMLRSFRDGAWRSIAWGEFGRMAASCARHLRAAGVAAGDRVVIVVGEPAGISDRRDRADGAARRSRCRPTRPTPCLITRISCGIPERGRRSCPPLPSPARCARPAAGRRVGTAGGDRWPAGTEAAAPRLLHWHELVADDDAAGRYRARGGGHPGQRAGMPDLHVGHRRRAEGRDAAASLHPVELSRRVRIAAADAAAGRGVSVVLAASHGYEHTVGHVLPVSIGTEIVYCRGVEHLAADMLTVRPTILTAVPRVLEVIRNRIRRRWRANRGWQQALFRLALDIGLRRIDGRTADVREHCWICCSSGWCAPRCGPDSGAG